MRGDVPVRSSGGQADPDPPGGTGLSKSVGQPFLELGANFAICIRRGEVLEEAARTRRADLRTRGIGVQRTRRQSPLSGKLRIAAPERLVLTGRRLT